jgi:hypothetical protein
VWAYVGFYIFTVKVRMLDGWSVGRKLSKFKSEVSPVSVEFVEFGRPDRCFMIKGIFASIFHSRTGQKDASWNVRVLMSTAVDNK